MKLLSQRNPFWSQSIIGLSKLTVGRFGCCLTSVSMLSDYFNCFLSPFVIASHKEWFTQDGLVLWKKMEFDKFRFDGRYYGRNDAAIAACLKDPNRAVILQVSDASHLVVCLRKTLFGNSYVVADPWDATKCDVIKKYRNITGFATFIKK